MNDKNQAAIDHVASVSKHPHAAMIVKWLITGCKVKSKISGEIAPKPAYRVYADPDGDLFVAERNSKGGICQTFTEGCRWISDWIEYDPLP